MKIRLLPAAFILLISVISAKANAQIPHASIYAHAVFATPLDKSSQNLYTEGGGGVGGILLGSKSTKFNGSIGYMHFFKDNENLLGDETYVPVKIGIRQYIPLTFHFLYLQGNAGLGFVSYKEQGNNYSPFAFDFGAGVKFGGFEGALIWENFHEKNPEGLSSWLTIQAGFNIGF